MGNYLNPGNDNFSEILNDIFIDKTGLIEFINNSINRSNRLTCISRPRRFGKSYIAQMLCAYYDKTCDSHGLFSDLEISKSKTYEEHINGYDVIYLDMTAVIGETSFEQLVPYIKRNLIDEITQAYPEVEVKESFVTTLLNTIQAAGNKLIAIIDEWDAPIREAGGDGDSQRAYLDFLRLLFKNSGQTNKIFAAAYMTGILPIKKDGSQSAVSNFKEYSVLDPMQYAGYVGFREDEVEKLCNTYSRNFETVKKWYDGYSLGDEDSIYNPYSVMCAMESGKYKSYWKKTTAAEALMTYIDMNHEGLQEDIARLITGESIEVDTESFQNDPNAIACKDDVLTLLVHLGYLTYEEVTDSYGIDGNGSRDEEEYIGIVRIPNEEVRTEFDKLLRKSKHDTMIQLVKASDRLLEATLSGDEKAVSEAIEKVSSTNYAPTFSSNEQSLRYLIKMAYISCVDQYMKIEELPSGKGIADVVFIPKRKSNLPAMIIELKWNKTSSKAFSQIKKNNYPAVISDYGGEIVLVGINYDSKNKEYTCKIEKAG